MPPETAFQELIRRVRAGDQEAAAELVRRYEPAIRVAVRVRLTDPRLRRIMDSMDICQSVLANFFVRAASGQFEINEPEELLKLLSTMARNKLVNHALKHRAARRDVRRIDHRVRGQGDFRDPEPTPSQIVADRDLLREFHDRLDPQFRRVVDLRTQGRSWAEIAAEVGGTPDAVRVQFSRALDRAARELELDSDTETA